MPEIFHCFCAVFLVFCWAEVFNCQTDFVTYEACGGIIRDHKVIIKSPNYPKTPEERTKYDNDLECLWKMNSGDPNTLFLVKFWDLVTENRPKQNDPNDTICFDYVNITIGDLETQQYCGWTAPEELYRAVGNRLEILFYTDGDTVYRGFMLSFQAILDHDPCRDEPCVNGQCIIEEDKIMFECNCEPGFTGYTCNVDIDECESDPCKNGGRCEQSKGIGYSCYCTEGWQGTNCEIVRKPDPCLSNPCRNDGACEKSDDNEEFYCSCSPGYTGITCRIDIDECDSSPCQNGGICEDGVNKYECTCDMPWYGDHCENKQKINGCEKGPCAENGDCIKTDDDGGFRCECIPGWAGILCEEDLQECASSPCKNGGICDDTKEFNRFDCTCIKGYTGKFCEIDMEFNFTDPTSTTSLPEEIEFITEADEVIKNTTIKEANESSYSVTSDSALSNMTTFDSFTEDMFESSGFGKGECVVTTQNQWVLERMNSSSILPTVIILVFAWLLLSPPMCKNPGIPYLSDDTQWEEGSTLRFYCIEGYILTGPEYLTCLKNESWSRIMPECVVDKNSTAPISESAVSPWLGTMIALSSMLAVTLVAFIAWIMLKGPWTFGNSVTRILSFSQASLNSGCDPYKQC